MEKRQSELAWHIEFTASLAKLIRIHSSKAEPEITMNELSHSISILEQNIVRALFMLKELQTIEPATKKGVTNKAQGKPTLKLLS